MTLPFIKDYYDNWNLSEAPNNHQHNNAALIAKAADLATTIISPINKLDILKPTIANTVTNTANAITRATVARLHQLRLNNNELLNQNVHDLISASATEAATAAISGSATTTASSTAAAASTFFPNTTANSAISATTIMRPTITSYLTIENAEPELHQHHNIMMVVLMVLFLCITLTIAVVIFVFCRKKNSVFMLQKCEQDSDLDLEMNDIHNEEVETSDSEADSLDLDSEYEFIECSSPGMVKKKLGDSNGGRYGIISGYDPGNGFNPKNGYNPGNGYNPAIGYNPGKFGNSDYGIMSSFECTRDSEILKHFVTETKVDIVDSSNVGKGSESGKESGKSVQHFTNVNGKYPYKSRPNCLELNQEGSGKRRKVQIRTKKKHKQEKEPAITVPLLSRKSKSQTGLTEKHSKSGGTSQFHPTGSEFKYHQTGSSENKYKQTGLCSNSSEKHPQTVSNSSSNKSKSNQSNATSEKCSKSDLSGSPGQKCSKCVQTNRSRRKFTGPGLCNMPAIAEHGLGFEPLGFEPGQSVLRFEPIGFDPGHRVPVLDAAVTSGKVTFSISNKSQGQLHKSDNVTFSMSNTPLGQVYSSENVTFTSENQNAAANTRQFHCVVEINNLSRSDNTGPIV